MATATLIEPIAPPEPILPDDDVHYEVVDGQLVGKPPMGVLEVHVATTLLVALYQFAKDQALGRAECEMLFLIDRTTGQKRRPDLAFVSYKRWPRESPVPRTEAWDVVPDLAIEVISPTNTANAMVAKIVEYFAAGAVSVWVVYPIDGYVYVYDSPKSVQILTGTDEIDGGSVLPGFRLALIDLFEDAIA